MSEAAEQQADLQSQLETVPANTGVLSTNDSELRSKASETKLALEAGTVVRERSAQVASDFESVLAQRDRLLNGLRLARAELLRVRQEAAEEQAAQFKRLMQVLAKQIDFSRLVGELRLEIAALQTQEAARADELALELQQRCALIERHEAAQSGLLRERDQLVSQRDEVTAWLLAITESESWRVGYALTSPARWIKRMILRPGSRGDLRS